MKKIFTTTVVFSILIGLLINTSCKKSRDVTEYTLTVTVNEGVSGTPGTGTYTYTTVEDVAYSYTLQEGYTALSVLIDGQAAASSGTVTMDGDHYIVVNAGKGTGAYRLSVSVSTGAVGTPATGSYYYDAGEQVNYNYSLENGYTNLRVSLDGANIGTAGTITISKNHALYVYAEKEYYIQGSWTLAEKYEDGSSFTVTVTFTGETESGTVVDSDGGAGTYTVSGANVSFIIEYPEVIYEYTGFFSEEGKMSGDSRRYYVNENIYNKGNWAAAKNTE
jgi:hypothetical protein